LIDEIDTSHVETLTLTMDALLRQLRKALPAEVATLAQEHLENLEKGEYESILKSTEAQELLQINKQSQDQGNEPWNDVIFQRLSSLLSDRSKPETQVIYFCIGYAALLAFLQSNVTGPPLPFNAASTLLPENIASSPKLVRETRRSLLAGLALDGIAAYRLTPNVELLCLADAIFTSPAILKNIKMARWAKIRAKFMHQRLLSEVSATLQDVIYEDLSMVADDLEAAKATGDFDQQAEGEFLLERSTIHIHHGLDSYAKDDIESATKNRGFKFALTGLLGKRTKFQQKETSQLVVLARSAETPSSENQDAEQKAPTAPTDSQDATAGATAPDKLDLNDDTLLESISFTKKSEIPTDIQAMSDLPQELQDLDPSDQPKLQPLDSSILLSIASSIKNTSPENGLTREETIPYATRVLEGGSSNWQVYTQALLVRSRIEGYRSRTIERGLLQLQALVDQVIADTANGEQATEGQEGEAAANTFLPKAKESESAPVTERMQYIFQLASPTRWDLEAELASRWVSLGGLRSALDIYQRLEMWAEAALCWAATEREDKARSIVRRELFHATDGASEDEPAEDEQWLGPARDPAPLEAPRLYCILADIDSSPELWEKAWEVSNNRYARAQRSLGRHYIAANDYIKAALAYSKALTVDKLNQPAWFAFGCTLLELSQFDRAVEAFTRCVQLDDTDAESWSNLGAALMKTDPEAKLASNKQDQPDGPTLDDEEERAPIDHDKELRTVAHNTRVDALIALKRAATLKHDSFRIWDNVLTVAASLSPPDYGTMLTAQKRIVDIRGKAEGEACLDVAVVQVLVAHVIATNESYNPSAPGLARFIVRFVDESVVPLITSSAPLWQLVSKLALWRHKPTSALEAEEKAWRAVTAQPGWESESEKRWDAVVDATVRLCDSYESFGPMERTEGMGAGELVAKDWKFKARSAIKGIMRKGEECWGETTGYGRLQEALDGLKSS
jgi:tetratricopeptide (TPR) repeat protein